MAIIQTQAASTANESIWATWKKAPPAPNAGPMITPSTVPTTPAARPSQQSHAGNSRDQHRERGSQNRDAEWSNDHHVEPVGCGIDSNDG